jgi:hypothetical protein
MDGADHVSRSKMLNGSDRLIRKTNGQCTATQQDLTVRIHMCWIDSGSRENVSLRFATVHVVLLEQRLVAQDNG